MNLPLQALSTIRARNLFKPGQRVVVGVSGGADSVALLNVLISLSGRLRIKLVVAHLDHRIRGDAAEADAAFVKKLAARLKVPCEVARVDVPALARKTSLSLEMAARTARYAFFAEVVKKTGAQAVAVAHNADDQAETIVLNLARGSGMRGLGGIRYCAELDSLRVVRPLLDATRAEIIRYLEGIGATWREDETNSDSRFLRNRVRHEVLPFLEKKLNPDIRGALRRAGEVLRAEDELLADVAAGILEACTGRKAGSPLSVAALCGYPVALRRRAIRQWLSMNNVPPDVVDYDLVDRVDALARSRRAGSRVDAGSGRIVRKRYGMLTTEKGKTASTASFRAAVRIPGETILQGPRLRIVATQGSGVIKDLPRRAGRLPAKASVSLRAIGRRKLIVRSWRAGDRMRPLGMRGSKKLQDIFVDDKVSCELRGTIPVFECGGEIIWLTGHSIAAGWELKSPSEQALHLLVEAV